MNKPSLDQLRIERKPDEDASSKGWLVLAAVLVFAVGMAAWLWWPREQVVEVRTAVVQAATGPQSGTVLNASGYVTARRQATVSSKVTGKVTEILIEEGMDVDEGQVLARLDATNVYAALELARAQFDSARTTLKETQALLDEAELNFDRIDRLAADGLASEAELDRARATMKSLAARLESRESEVEVARRQVGVYDQHLEDTIIRAPFAGVVVAKNAQPGEMISPISAGGGFTRTGIGTIVDMDSLEIEIDVNEAYIDRVRPGQPVVATLDAYPEWKIPCHVIAIIPTADRQKATVEVRVGFDALDQRILPDMGVKVAFQDEVENGKVAPGVLVPTSALRRDAGRDIVWVVSEGVLERRAVSTAAGVVAGSERVVLAGLRAGERVVIEGPEDLATGMIIEERAE
jgi:RND family efflux transporter MFP subunit